MLKYWVTLFAITAIGAIAIFINHPNSATLEDVKSLNGIYTMKEWGRFAPDSAVDGKLVCTSSDFFGNCGSLEIRNIVGSTISIKYVMTPTIFGEIKTVTEATAASGQVLYRKSSQAIRHQWIWSSLLWLSSIPVFFGFIIFNESRHSKSTPQPDSSDN
jgi:hypothetical protein